MSMPADARPLPNVAEPSAPGGGDPYSRRVERAVDVLRHRAKGATGRAPLPPPQWALIHAELARARGRRAKETRTD
jgi:hypothetical protein